MKVYFIGSHSVGKSTLARYVSEKYNLPMVVEVARQILSERELQVDSLRIDLNLTDSYQSDIFYRQIIEESKHNKFVSDRSFDCLSYAAQHSRVLSNLIHSQELKTYLEVLRQPDSYIFFVRPSKATLKADGVREALNWDGITAIDSMIKFMLEMWNLRYFQINIDNMQERVRLIDNILSLHTS